MVALQGPKVIEKIADVLPERVDISEIAKAISV